MKKTIRVAQEMASFCRRPSSGSGFWGLFFLVCLALSLAGFGLLSSRGQNSFPRNPAISQSIGNIIDAENSVFSPLMKSGTIRKGISSNIRVVYDGSQTDDSPLWKTDLRPWWMAEANESGPSEAERQFADINQTREIASSKNNAYRKGKTTQLYNQWEANRQAAVDFITSGVMDLLDSLRDTDRKTASGNGGNPFSEALDSETKLAAAAKTEKATSSPDHKAEPNKTSQENTPGKTAPVNTGASAIPTYLVVGNFNAGNAPVAIAASLSSPFAGQSSSLSFDLAGLGKQSFDLNVLLRSQQGQESVATGDLNNDGIMDLVVNNMYANRSYIYLGNGTDYVLYDDMYGGLGPVAAAISDFNNDGSMDLAVGYLINKRVAVDGKGLRKYVFLPTSSISEEFQSILPYDFNGDGFVDLLVMNYRNSTATIYINQGDATFVPSQAIDYSTLPITQYAIDLNGDGVNDIVYLQYLQNHISLTMQDGRDGSIVGLGNFIIDPSSYVVLGDFNHDGIVDVALAKKSAPGVQ